MGEKLIEWENVAGKYLGRVDGAAQYVCRTDPKSGKYIGFEFDDHLELKSITKPDDYAITIARVESYHAQKTQSILSKKWEGYYDKR